MFIKPAVMLTAQQQRRSAVYIYDEHSSCLSRAKANHYGIKSLTPAWLKRFRTPDYTVAADETLCTMASP